MRALLNIPSCKRKTDANIYAKRQNSTGSGYFRRHLKDLRLPRFEKNKSDQSLFTCGHAIDMVTMAAESIISTQVQILSLLFHLDTNRKVITINPHSPEMTTNSNGALRHE